MFRRTSSPRFWRGGAAGEGKKWRRTWRSKIAFEGLAATIATADAHAARDRGPRPARGGRRGCRGRAGARRRIVVVDPGVHDEDPASEPPAILPGARDPVAREEPARHGRAQPDRPSRPRAAAREEGGADDGARVLRHLVEPGQV